MLASTVTNFLQTTTTTMPTLKRRKRSRGSQFSMCRAAYLADHPGAAMPHLSIPLLMYSSSVFFISPLSLEDHQREKPWLLARDGSIDGKARFCESGWSQFARMVHPLQQYSTTRPQVGLCVLCDERR